MENTPSLHERLTRLEDIEAIKKLTAIYALYVDKGRQGGDVDLQRLHTVFTEDATWTCEAMGVAANGRQEIINTLRDATAKIELALHSFTNPIIDITDQFATANFLLWVAVEAGDSVSEVFQTEELIYVKTTDGWLIKSIELFYCATISK